MSGTKKLVIVESPTKARTISGYLGDDYEVIASVGHIRDLAEPAALPAALKQGAFGKFAVDVDNDFKPYYLVADNKKKTVTDLKRALKNSDELLLATDEDREGEAIAWHLLEVLKPQIPVKRMVFHEITKDAIENAKNNTRELDSSLVDAQEARRILDRLYGYDVSPVLWRKVGPKLSAGRVQSAATRLVVDRERQRMEFTAAGYWSITALFSEASSFEAKLQRLNGCRIALGADFDDSGKLNDRAQKAEVQVLTAEKAAEIVRAIDEQATVSNRETKPYTRRPAAPFTTSTLQQEASRKLRFSSRQTMSLAQSLYENGHITYMRTDSPALSGQAINAARTQAAELYGSESVAAKPRIYKGKSKGAQEAHEAIRPAGATFATPDQLRGKLTPGEFSLYELIWKRTVASQMADASGSTDTITIATVAGADKLEFAASGTVITFPGFMLAYEEGRDDKKSEQDSNVRLPQLAVGAKLRVSDAEAKSHETTPPARYTEASLTKRLEELGIGRPSTYATIMSTIMDRGYVVKKGQALVPSWIAFSVVRLLEEHFSELVNYDFTAEMEDDLDRIAAGETDRTQWLRDFYFGTSTHPGLRGVIDNLGEIDARAINTIKISDTIALRNGRYGPYLEVVDEQCEVDADGVIKPRAVSIPEGIEPDELTPEKAEEIAGQAPAEDRVLGIHPETGREIVAKNGRFGPYVTEKLRDDETLPKGQKLLTASLFKAMTPETVDFATAMQLLSLPRVVGQHPETGADITAQNGRFGPYLKSGTETRTLPNEDAIFGITLAEAVEILAQPKYGARKASTALREFDNDPVSGKPIRVRDGRFGPYITDGETNITVPRGVEIEEITYEQAVQLLADKRAKGPAKRGRGAKATAKKTTAKKTTAKKTTAKAGAKKAVDPARSAAAKKAAATRKANAAAKAAAAAAAEGAN